MADLDKLEGGGGGGAVVIADIRADDGGVAVEERERLTELEGISVLDFDLLCSTVALQTQGKWRKLESSEGEDATEDDYGGGVLRLWEGDVMDCLEDRHLCIESACCPCYRFGKNMTRTGFGSCFLQGAVHMILIAGFLFNVVAFAVTKRHCFLYLAIAFVLLIGSYLGFFRMLIRRKFNIRGTDSFLDDFIHHLVCPFCTLTQESKTLEMNNVHDGIWHGRGDTLCIGGYSEGKAFLELHSPPVIASTMSSSQP
ncbi:putative PLAC8 motif-containing protein [Arabidopsis thaliana]